MNDAKYMGLDVHQATVSAAVLDSAGKLVLEAILETKAETILQFIHGLRSSLHVTFEEGTCAAWLHDLLKPLEERSEFRRRISKTTSSLSVCRESIPGSSWIMTGWFFRRSGSRASIHNPVRRVLRALSLSRNPMPPRTTRKSDRQKASDRTMVGTAQPLCFACVRN